MKRRTTMLKKLPLATAIALSFAASGQAADFEVGDYEIKFDFIFYDPTLAEFSFGTGD